MKDYCPGGEITPTMYLVCMKHTLVMLISLKKCMKCMNVKLVSKKKKIDAMELFSALIKERAETGRIQYYER